MAEKDFIGLRGNKNLWKRFVNRLRNENKKVWDDVLAPFIADYLKKKR